MASKTEILRAQSGVVLKKVSLAGVTAYSVSTKRTPEVWQTADLMAANRFFDDEVERCDP